MFKTLAFYTHRNMMDCNILVLKSYKIPDGRYKLKIEWYLKNGKSMGFRDSVIVSRKQLNNWSEVT